VELLAPAGNLNTFYVAVGNGANAVYLGLKDFSARKSAENFSYEELSTAVKFARVMGVKVYVALNTLVKENELEQFFDAVYKVYNLGVDAVILQDLFLGKYIHERLPALELHLSTQGGVNNLEGAVVAKEYGFKRVILARETPISEIKKIATFMDTEVFIQGALCTSFSGHCYMSSFGGGNSGNRGLCKQPCRRTYTLGKGEENYAICTADLCVGESIFELKKAGVKSLKIEGRMRRAEYVSASLHYYRSLLYPHEKVGGELSALKRTYNRGDYTKGLAFGQDKKFLSTAIQGHVGECVGKVSKVLGTKILVKGSLNPTKSDCFKILRNGKEVGSAEYQGEKAKDAVPLVFKGEVEVGDDVYITTDVRLNRELSSSVSCRVLDLEFSARENEKARATLYADGVMVADCLSDVVLPTATGKPLDEDQIKSVFMKAGEYPFAVYDYNVEIVGKPFGVKSVLNALRRKAYEQAYEKLSSVSVAPAQKIAYEKPMPKIKEKSTAVIGESFEDLAGYDIAIFAPSDYTDERYFQKFFASTQNAKERYLYIPSLINSKDIEILGAVALDFDGIYGENPAVIELARRWNKKLFIGQDFNLFNSISLAMADEICEHVATSKELSEKEIYGTGYANSSFVSVRGDLKVMELGYCPYGKNCAKCTAPTLNSLTDYAGRKFALRRIKLSRCYFEVYNPMELIYDDFNLSLYNFVLHKGKGAEERMNASVKEYRGIARAVTSGHLKNPVE